MKALRQIGSLVFVLGLFVSIFGGIPWSIVTYDDPVIPMWLRTSVFCLLGGILVVLVTLALEQKAHVAKTGTPPETPMDLAIPVLNCETIPGKKVTEALGIVEGHTVFAIWLGKDLSAIVRLILGGELTEYTEMMGAARRTAAARMVEQAREKGADAVINVRYMTTSVVGSAAELLVYGTAVKLAD